MSSSSSNHPLPPVPPDPQSPPGGGGVRRHHTISAASRTARAQAKDIISEETTAEQALWNDDEPVDQDWVGGVGAVGEKTSLHRQSSLPTRYHRGFHGSTSGNMTPKTVNSLAAIAGHEGDEEPWNLAEYNVQDDDQQHLDAQAQAANSPLSPHFNQQPPHVPSPPPAASGVRRHVSLTYGAAVGGPRKMNSGLKRSGTLQAAIPAAHNQGSSSPDPAEHPEEESEYTYEAEDPNANAGPYNVDEEYYSRQQAQLTQQQYGGSIGRSSPWSQNNDWRAPGNTGYGNNSSNAIDDVQRALSALEIASSGGNGGYGGGVGTYQGGQSVHPPRFNPSQPPPAQPRGGNNGNNNNTNGGNGGNGSKLPLEYDGRKTPLSQGQGGRGQGTWQQQQYQQQRGDERGPNVGGAWDQKDRALTGRQSSSNLQYGYQQGGASGHGKSGSGSSAGAAGAGGSNIPSVPMIPQQYLQQAQQTSTQGQGSRPGLGVATSFSGNGNNGSSIGAISSGQTPTQGPFVSTPIDVPSLIASKGYNPANFDTRPQFARYFVIKSYTEDDVHKSLKYEIWSSTDPGNKRLDKAFKETAGRGPIYLFFSVNASGHFCGMAEMLTPVDYTRSSTVWASDKWKGVFKVRWIFVRDIPNVNLRHIKLNNTQERKPVTNSRDTQELLPDAGQEMLRIFHTHPARTSLLQDFAFYELQAMQKMQASATGSAPNAPISTSGLASGASSPPNQPSSVVHSPQLGHTSVPSTSSSTSSHSHHNSGAISPPTGQYQNLNNTYGMSPMMQMQMQMGMGMGGMGGMGITGMGGMGLGVGGMGMGNMGMGGMGMGNPAGTFGVHQQTHQAVMRHPSPGEGVPQQGGQNQGYGGY